jgi:hypothetical protein
MCQEKLQKLHKHWISDQDTHVAVERFRALRSLHQGEEGTVVEGSHTFVLGTTLKGLRRGDKDIGRGSKEYQVGSLTSQAD